VNIFFASYGEAEAIRFARRLRPLWVNFIVTYPPATATYQFAQFARRNLTPRLDRVIVLNEAMRVPVEQALGRAAQVIPIGVDLDYFTPDAAKDMPWRERLGLQPDERVLLSVAALEARKGIDHVLDAMPGLLAEGIAVHYVVAGEGPQRAVLEQ